MTTGMALAMSPMTAAIMSAVPPRRAGAGSAMNDATRELGAALGIAVMGSIASSQYSRSWPRSPPGCPKRPRHRERLDLRCVGGRLPAAGRRRRGAEGRGRIGVRRRPPLRGHGWELLALGAAFLVWKFLPRTLAHEGAMHGAVEAMEDAAELGIAGVPPVFADEEFVGDDDRRRDDVASELDTASG